MFRKKLNPLLDGLNAEIEYVRAQFRDYPPESPEYKEMATRYSELHDQIVKIPTGRPSPDVLATVAANLVGLALITQYERVAVIGGHAIKFVRQLKN